MLLKAHLVQFQCTQLRRFITLIDALYEHKVLVVVLADAPILQLFSVGGVKASPPKPIFPSAPVPYQQSTSTGGDVVHGTARAAESVAEVAVVPAVVSTAPAPVGDVSASSGIIKTGGDKAAPGAAVLANSGTTGGKDAAGHSLTNGVASDCDSASATTAARLLHDEVIMCAYASIECDACRDCHTILSR